MTRHEHLFDSCCIACHTKAMTPGFRNAYVTHTESEGFLLVEKRIDEGDEAGFTRWLAKVEQGEVPMRESQ